MELHLLNFGKHPKIPQKKYFRKVYVLSYKKPIHYFFISPIVSSRDICERRKIEGVLLTFVWRFHICILKKSLSNAKMPFFSENGVFIMLGCCFCCFSKSREPGDIATYFYFLNDVYLKSCSTLNLCSARGDLYLYIIAQE